MKHTPQCPLCGSQAEVVEATPCWQCGNSPDRIRVLEQDTREQFQHDSITYSLHGFPGGVEIALCHGCAISCGSYRPEHWGLSGTRRIGFEHLQFLQDVAGRGVQKTQWCPSCGWSLKYSEALLAIRDALAGKS